MPVPRRLKLLLLWPLLVLVVLLALLRIALAPLGKYAITDWFAQQGIEAGVEDISFDFRQGRVQLQNFSAGSTAQPKLAIEKLTVDWDWRPLLDNRVRVNDVGLTGVFVDIERGEDDRLVIGGIDLARGTAPEVAAAETAPAEPLAWTMDIGNFEIEDFKHCYRAPLAQDYCGGFERLAWRGDLVLDLAQLEAADLPLEVAGDFRIDKLTMRNNLLQRKLVELERFGLDGIRIEGLGAVTIEEIQLAALDLLERGAQSERPRISRLDRLRVNQLSLRDLQRLEIDAVELSGLEATLVKLEDGSLEIADWLPPQAADNRAREPSPVDDRQRDFSFALGRLSYDSDRSLRYEDRSLERPFIVDLNSIRLQLQNLDSQAPEQASRVEYTSRYAAHGSIELAGEIRPLANKPSFDVEGRISGLDLRDLSAFTADAIGHRIKSGQLDADLGLRADQAVLDSVVDLTLNQFTLTAVSSEDEEKLDSSFGFPLNASLSLLKDRDNRIQLQIPITGDLENPDFDPTDAITQATSTAITAAVLNYYTPFGLVTLADGLFSLATALRFEPVAYPAGGSDIGTIDTAELDRIAELMSERPGVAVTLCGFTNSADRIALLAETAEIPADQIELDEVQLAALTQLGEARTGAIKDYLVKRKIDAARLILCDAEHAEGEGLAGVEISI